MHTQIKVSDGTLEKDLKIYFNWKKKSTIISWLLNEMLDVCPVASKKKKS